MIAEEAMSNDKLVEVLNNAGCETSIDNDGDVYVKSGIDFPIWVSVDNDIKYIKLLTWFAPEGIDDDDMLSCANFLNSTYKIAQFATVDDKMYATYFFPFEGGLQPGSIMKVVRRFSSIIHAAGTALPESFQENQSDSANSPTFAGG